ncbi:MAG: hypothetical protein M3Q56_01330 [Bacteroidota bacterium]|nr:hypothetical protein [Bacteroidota bacterium]
MSSYTYIYILNPISGSINLPKVENEIWTLFHKLDFVIEHTRYRYCKKKYIGDPKNILVAAGSDGTIK